MMTKFFAEIVRDRIHILLLVCWILMGLAMLVNRVNTGPCLVDRPRTQRLLFQIICGPGAWVVILIAVVWCWSERWRRGLDMINIVGYDCLECDGSWYEINQADLTNQTCRCRYCGDTRPKTIRRRALVQLMDAHNKARKEKSDALPES